jgi:hypothetical protein
MTACRPDSASDRRHRSYLLGTACYLAQPASRIRGDVMAMDWHDTLMGSVLIISAGLTFAYTRAASRTLLILALAGAAGTLVTGVLLFFHLA